MKYTIAIDQSTSASKIMLFDETLALVAKVSLEHKQYYPKPGWVEHNAGEILENIYKGVELLLNSTNTKPTDILSVAITNQRETIVVWDKHTGEPIYNAVVWQCNRGAELCEILIKENYETIIRQKTGLLLNPYFSASGVSWILDNVAGARDNAKKGNLLMGTIDSWLIWNLTDRKVHATDYTNASRTLLFNIHTFTWDNSLLKIFNIEKSMMPNALPSDSIFGTTTFNGILPEIPIAGVLGDSHGALVGQMCFSSGMGKATYGTGSSIMINIGDEMLPPPAGLVTSVGFSAQGKTYYAFEGNIHCTGATIKWLEDELQLIQSASETEELANSVDSTDGVYFVPAFTGLGAPWWDNDAKALICGMTRGTTKAHFVRAALESIAYQVKDLIGLIDKAGVSLKELRVDGGPVKNNFLMQFQADILKSKIDRSPIEEASALGAIIMNGFALGQIKSFDSIKIKRGDENKILPTMKNNIVDELYSGWCKAIRRVLMK